MARTRCATSTTLAHALVAAGKAADEAPRSRRSRCQEGRSVTATWVAHRRVRGRATMAFRRSAGAGFLAAAGAACFGAINNMLGRKPGNGTRNSRPTATPATRRPSRVRDPRVGIGNSAFMPGRAAGSARLMNRGGGGRRCPASRAARPRRGLEVEERPRRARRRRHRDVRGWAARPGRRASSCAAAGHDAGLLLRSVRHHRVVRLLAAATPAGSCDSPAAADK